MPEFTLHEAVSKAFDRTTNGSIFTKDVKTIYSLMVICLRLSEQKQKTKLSFLNRQWAFAFTVQDAITTMGSLQLNVESSSTSTTVSYSIKPELATSLLKTFFSAKLLHTPADRTRDEPKDKVVLQPTPKGVALVQSYCELNGVKYGQMTVPIIRSVFNSMDLFLFERSPITGTIIYSEYFIHLLFARFIGPKPNIWSSTNASDPIPSLEHRLQMDDEFDFSNFNDFVMPLTDTLDFSVDGPDLRKKYDNNNNNNNINNNNGNNGNNGIAVFRSKAKPRESPFHHNFFTNPDSDSHIQYYVSDRGVRLYNDYAFGDIKIKYCFNAKAAWQWLMDCTDIIYPQEATNILNLFFRYGLIDPIILSPSTATSKKCFVPKKTSLYTLSKKGWDISHWGKSKKSIHVADGEEITTGECGIILNNQALVHVENVSSDDENANTISRLDQLDVKKVLSDPGLRYLFRLHLEKEYCAENLDVYMDIRHFTKKMTILMSLMELQKKPPPQCEIKVRTPSKRALVKLINECLSSAYNIYSSYITPGATYQLNIDHLLREKITETMLHTAPSLRAYSDKSAEPAMIDSSIPARPEAAFLRPAKGCEEEHEPVLKQREESHTPRMMNNKKLSIEIPRCDSDACNTPMTPTHEEMSRSLEMLEKLFPLVDLVGKQILKMLEFDSFPKFVKSDTVVGALD